MIEKLATLLPWRRRDANEVRIRYAWDVQRKRIARWLIWKLNRPLRAMLVAYDKLTTFSAEGFDDLSFREWFAIKWCEWHKRHMGYRQNISGLRYCSHCQCLWDKLDQRYDVDGRRRK